MPRDLFSEDPLTTLEDIIDLYVVGQDTDFTPSSEDLPVLSQWVAQLEDEVDEKDKTINKL